MGDRVILHSDINCCYASIEHLHHPELAGKPLAVGGDPEARHGITFENVTFRMYQAEELWDYCFEKKTEPFFQYYFEQYCGKEMVAMFLLHTPLPTR